MDPVTHAASGAVAMLALPSRPVTRWAVPLAALASASPDLAIVFASTPLQFLLLHRGITHSLAAMPVLGLLRQERRHHGHRHGGHRRPHRCGRSERYSLRHDHRGHLS